VMEEGDDGGLTRFSQACSLIVDGFVERGGAKILANGNPLILRLG